MIVVDELHMVFDSSRGQHIEHFLAKTMFYNRSRLGNVRIIGMSATIPHLETIGTWLNAKVYESNFRPIELNERIVVGHQMRSISSRGIDDTVVRHLPANIDPVISIAEANYKYGHQTLMFCSSKAESEKIAIEFAKSLDQKIRTNLVFSAVLEKRKAGLLATKLGLEKVGSNDRLLMLALARGVAFHHAGLTTEERDQIEKAFRDGSVMMLVATSTLSSGVNLPAEKVIIKAKTRGPSAVTNMSYRQMIGRAGRMGYASKGESFLIVRPADEKQVLEALFDRGKERSGTRRRDICRYVLESICTGLATSREDVALMTSQLRERSTDEEVDEALLKLRSNSFIADKDEEKGTLSPTQLGRATLASSLPPDAALSIFDDLNNATKAIAIDTELHMLYLVTPVNVSVWQECDWNHLFELFSRLSPEHRRVAKLTGVSEKFILEQLRGRRSETDDKKMQVHTRFFSALALFDLISEVSLNEVSRKYRISRGCLQTLQTQSSTYAAMVVAFCQRLGWTYLKSLLDGFAMRLFFGIRSELSELVTVDGIDGQRARVLHEKGLTCLSQLASCDEQKLGHYLTLAVPYSSSNQNDGKGEWLFGEDRVYVNEAARLLKERARRLLLTRIRELGVSIDVYPLEETKRIKFDDVLEGKKESIVKDEVQSQGMNEDSKEKRPVESSCHVKNESQAETCDSGLGDSLQDSIASTSRSGRRPLEDTNGRENVSCPVEEMQELSLVEDEDDGENHILNSVNDGIEEVADVVDCLETSLLKIRPPQDKTFLRRLSQVYVTSPNTASTSTRKSVSRIYEQSCDDDSFDASIVLVSKTRRNSLAAQAMENEAIRSKRRSSIVVPQVDVSVDVGDVTADISTASASATESSFDVFATPPSQKKSSTKPKPNLKHKRVSYSTSVSSPFSCYVSSPIHKQQKCDPNRFALEDVTSDEKLWSQWLKSCSQFAWMGVALRTDPSTRKITGIAVSAPTITVFIPLTENPSRLESRFEMCSTVEPPVILLSRRIEGLRLVLSSCQSVYVFDVECCYSLHDEFKMQITNPRVLSVLTHLLHMEGSARDSISSLVNRVNNWQSDFDDVLKSSDNVAICGVSAFVMKRLFNHLSLSAIASSSEQSVELEIQAAKVVVGMFHTGIPFDAMACAAALSVLRKKADFLQSECWKLANTQFNLESPAEVANVLYSRLHLVCPGGTKTSKRQMPTSKDVLEQMVPQHEIVQKIIKYRHITHTISKCVIPLSRCVDNDESIRCWFEVCTSTGRILTQRPNVQNVPKRESLDGLCIRQLFRAKPGYILIGADYSQLELRVLAHLSADEKLLGFLSQERDLFAELSSEWSFPRDAVKQLCYGIIYGMGVKSIAAQTKLSMEEAERLWKNFFTMFPKVKTYIQETKDRAFRVGYVSTLLGRKRVTERCHIAEEKSREERVLVNYTIQGSASEIFKQALVDISQKFRGKEARIVMTVHDEVIVEARKEIAEEAADIVRVCMQNSLSQLLRVPMTVSVHTGNSWAKLK